VKHLTKEIESARQGEVYILRIKSLPSDAKKIEAKNGNLIVGHSETGHHHVIKESTMVNFYSSDNAVVSYLEVIEATEKTEVFLDHLRGYDTHETIGISEGVYAVINGIESAPEGWRRVQD
jgi:hypothetical protein